MQVALVMPGGAPMPEPRRLIRIDGNATHAEIAEAISNLRARTYADPVDAEACALTVDELLEAWAKADG